MSHEGRDSGTLKAFGLVLVRLKFREFVLEETQENHHFSGTSYSVLFQASDNGFGMRGKDLDI